MVQQDYDLVKFQRVEKEMLEDRDSLLAQLHEEKTKAERYFEEMKKSRDVNERLDFKNRDMMKKLEACSPTIIQEQKELIIDLKGKVNMLERELSLVTENTTHEINELRQQTEEAHSGKIGAQTEAAGNEEIFKMNIGKVRTLLVQSKKELEEASKQIIALK